MHFEELLIFCSQFAQIITIHIINTNMYRGQLSLGTVSHCFCHLKKYCMVKTSIHRTFWAIFHTISIWCCSSASVFVLLWALGIPVSSPVPKAGLFPVNNGKHVGETVACWDKHLLYVCLFKSARDSWQQYLEISSICFDLFIKSWKVMQRRRKKF